MCSGRGSDPSICVLNGDRPVRNDVGEAKCREIWLRIGLVIGDILRAYSEADERRKAAALQDERQDRARTGGHYSDTNTLFVKQVEERPCAGHRLKGRTK